MARTQKLAATVPPSSTAKNRSFTHYSTNSETCHHTATNYQTNRHTMIIKPQYNFMPNGPHEDKRIETVIIKFPDYIFWLAERDPNPKFRRLYDAIQRRVDVFDAKPFTNEQCAGKNAGMECTRPVTRFSLYRGSSIPSFWCSECDPLQLGANEGKIEVHATYYNALWCLHRANATREPKQSLIRRLAEAKGLTGNLTERKIRDFFGVNAG